MRLDSFADELISLRPSGELVKLASSARMIGRMAALGAAAGLGNQLTDFTQSALSGDAYLMPQQSAMTAATRGAIGGAAAGAVMAALRKILK